jgi:hypothetical protein
VDFFFFFSETPASEESDLTSEIFDQAPDGMSKGEFENWLDIDNNAEAVATMTVSEICEAVANDKSKLAEESESNCTSKEKDFRSSSNQRPDTRSSTNSSSWCAT